MNSDPCRNDCQEPWRFPKRLHNRPGLPHIDYRIGTYADIRAALLRRLDADEVLQAWTHRQPDDPGIALLEGAAILGDILTFYQDLYANEAFLRTAQWRESIADLVRLLGYRLSPGLGGKATFAFGIKVGRESSEPVVIPAGFELKAQVAGLAKAAEFQSEAEVIAYPALSQFHLYRPFQLPSINNGTHTFSVRTENLPQGLDLSKGDRLFLVNSPTNPNTQRQIVVIKDIQARFDRTEITIEGSWQQEFAGNLVHAYKLGRAFRHFGYNGPPQFVQLQGETAVATQVNFSRQLGNIPGQLVAIVAGYNPLSSFRSIPLDAQVADLTIGTPLLVQLILNDQPTAGGQSVDGETYFFEREIQQVTQASLTWGAVSGGTTVVELDANVTTGNQVFTDIRSLELLAVMGQRFILQGTYQETATTDLRTLYFFGDFTHYQHLHNRSLAFTKAPGISEILTTTLLPENLVPDNQVKLRPVSLPELTTAFTIDDFPLLSEPIVTVYGNLVEATQGKAEKETVLGNGDSRQIFQTFKLPKAPLTYFTDKSETPPEVPELEIYVNERLWQPVPSFFGKGTQEEIYIVREDVNGESWVQFGDGKTGARLPSGLKNIKAKYRTGTGAYGALKPETKVQATDKLTRLDQVWLPGAATGGSEPESGENAKAAAPGKIQSLGRLVSLQDFELETLAIAGVSKVSGAWQLVDNAPSVVLTVLMETGREQEITEVQGILNTYNRCRGPQRFPIRVIPGRVRYLYLRLIASLDPALRPEILTQTMQTALGVTGEEGNGVNGNQGLLGLAQRSFGQREYASRIEATIQNVAGIIWTRVEALGILPETDQPTEISYPIPDPLTPVVPCSATEILALHSQHLQLQFVAAPQEEC